MDYKTFATRNKLLGVGLDEKGNKVAFTPEEMAMIKAEYDKGVYGTILLPIKDYIVKIQRDYSQKGDTRCNLEFKTRADYIKYDAGENGGYPEEVGTTPIFFVGKMIFDYIPTPEESQDIFNAFTLTNDSGVSKKLNGAWVRIKSLEQAKEYIWKRIRAGGSFRPPFTKDDSCFEQIATPQTMRAISWLFGENTDGVLSLIESENEKLGEKFMYERIEKIVKVFHNKDHTERVAIVCKGGYDNRDIRLVFTDQNSNIFDYVDTGRLIFTDYYAPAFIWNDLQELPDLDPKILRKCDNRNGIINLDEYKKKAGKLLLEERQRTEQAELSALLRETINNKIDTELKQGFELNGFKFSSDGIEYGGMAIKGTVLTKHTRSVVDALREDIENEFSIGTLDFNDLFDRFCNKLHSFDFTGTLGVVPVTKTTENTKQGRITKINGIRINNNEAVDCLKKATCFNTKEEYDSFLTSVSKCSLKFHNALANGVDIRIDEDGFGEGGGVTLRIPLVREGNKNYVKVGEKKYRLKNSNKLINLDVKFNSNSYRWNNFDTIVATLTEVCPIDEDGLAALFEDGIKTYRNAVKKSEEFLKEAINVTKATEYEDNENGQGWIVTGLSGKQYFISKREDAHTGVHVYSYPSMARICIVNGNAKTGFKNDMIVSRMFALRNDTLVAKDIHTLHLGEGA